MICTPPQWLLPIDSGTDRHGRFAHFQQWEARIVAAAQQEIQQVTAQAERTLKQYAANLAFERAVSQLKLSEETDKELINDFIKDVTETIGGKR